MKNIFKRKIRSLDSPNWTEVATAWQSLMNTTQSLDFKNLFKTIVNCFISSPSTFLKSIKKSHHLPTEIPDNFSSLSDQDKANHFFAFFRLVFPYEELNKFVKQPNFQPANIKKFFGGHIPTLFKSICYLYQIIICSMVNDYNNNNSKTNDDDIILFNKYSPDVALAFGKLLVPNGNRHLTSTSFYLDHIYMSPTFFSADEIVNKPTICKIDENGEITIADAVNSSPIAKINQRDFTGMMDSEKLLFFDKGTKPAISLTFPTADNAADAFVFSMTPPKRGFMQMTSFLHSISAFEGMSKFFSKENSSSIQTPKEFTENLQKCLRSNTMELLLYEFVIPANEVKVTQATIEFYLEAIGDNFLPFTRALVQLNWMMSPYGGQLIVRQNSQLTVLCRMYLRTFAVDYMKYVNSEMKRIVENGGQLIKSMPISDDSDAQIFVEKVFDPIVEMLLASIPKMPDTLRALLRVMFVRCAGFYVNQSSPYLVVPNLMLLRYLIPPFTEESVVEYRSDPKMSKLAQLASSSLLSLFYQLGWTEDKDHVLSKYCSEMEKYYPRVEKFAYETINCHEFSYDYKAILKPQGDLAELVKGAAERVILMNLKDPNKVLHTHPHCVSIMQMIEEYTFDFTVNALNDKK